MDATSTITPEVTRPRSGSWFNYPPEPLADGTWFVPPTSEGVWFAPSIAHSNGGVNDH